MGCACNPSSLPPPPVVAAAAAATKASPLFSTSLNSHQPPHNKPFCLHLYSSPLHPFKPLQNPSFPLPKISSSSNNNNNGSGGSGSGSGGHGGNRDNSDWNSFFNFDKNPLFLCLFTHNLANQDDIFVANLNFRPLFLFFISASASICSYFCLVSLAEAKTAEKEKHEEEEVVVVREIRGGKKIGLVPDYGKDEFVVPKTMWSSWRWWWEKGSEDKMKMSVGDFWVQCRDLVLNFMLPEGFPESVTSDYLEYSLWRGVQGVAAQISGVLATQDLGAVAVRQPYIRVVGIEETNEADSRSPANFTADEIEEFKKFASDTNAYENICSKIAPSIFGHENVKKAVACLLFGGSRKTAQDNIDLQTTILSRFDLIFIVKDIRMYSQDKIIASHIIKVHASADATISDSRSSKEDNWMKRYIHYCRTHCHPRLSESAASVLQENYVKIRQDMRRQANETGEAAAIPITVRQLEAVVRLSEALARMRLSYVANENHVAEALRLFNNSTMDAARSGINQHINLTPEMANEIKQAETQIKRRMGIGSHISERRLIDELTRMGMNESIVRRALLIMHQRDEVEYKRERRLIVRKA